ncbi:hypothetical protein Dvina_24080 [Dactylosporangium vinaceum]|uniref:Uncharacterized protein n=1 Tax=Dactylosporangium vinaceum TaxID=53362 RepID=A0ABV5MD78_9ACTN|nr:hypothetical protein [Dactylosporangium vinaceum]UAC00860.1 hypothetical protein Dvina_24080 [Dactylosporangium vinaceum]
MNYQRTDTQAWKVPAQFTALFAAALLLGIALSAGLLLRLRQARRRR